MRRLPCETLPRRPSMPPPPPSPPLPPAPLAPAKLLQVFFLGGDASGAAPSLTLIIFLACLVPCTVCLLCSCCAFCCCHRKSIADANQVRAETAPRLRVKAFGLHTRLRFSITLPLCQLNTSRLQPALQTYDLIGCAPRPRRPSSSGSTPSIPHAPTPSSRSSTHSSTWDTDWCRGHTTQSESA